MFVSWENLSWMRKKDLRFTIFFCFDWSFTVLANVTMIDPASFWWLLRRASSSSWPARRRTRMSWSNNLSLTSSPVQLRSKSKRPWISDLSWRTSRKTSLKSRKPTRFRLIAVAIEYCRPEPRTLTRQSSRRSRLSTQQVVTLASTSPNHHGDRVSNFSRVFSQKKKKIQEIFCFIFLKFYLCLTKKKKKKFTNKF